jgi:hypothetical protein
MAAKTARRDMFFFDEFRLSLEITAVLIWSSNLVGRRYALIN